MASTFSFPRPNLSWADPSKHAFDEPEGYRVTSLSSTKVYLRPQCKRHIYANVPEFQRYTGNECQLVTSQLCNPVSSLKSASWSAELGAGPQGSPILVSEGGVHTTCTYSICCVRLAVGQKEFKATVCSQGGNI